MFQSYIGRPYNGSKVAIIDHPSQRGKMPGLKAPEEERREQILEAARRVAASQTLRGLTIRRVAEEAGLSNGLVLFHFKSKQLLLMALLDRVLEQTLGGLAHGLHEVGGPVPREVFRRLLVREIEQLQHERERVELFFDFWVMGTQHPEIRCRVRDSLEHYRALFREVTADLMARQPEAFCPMSPEGMAAVALSLVEGCAIQAVIDPARLDLDVYRANVEALLAFLPA